eukprot:SAG31_NODE_1517_length_8031_cov_18.008699_8_plen_126_part_00
MNCGCLDCGWRLHRFCAVYELAQVLANSFFSDETSIDHNEYVVDNIVYQANYCAGLRILRPTGSEPSPVMEQVDIYSRLPSVYSSCMYLSYLHVVLPSLTFSPSCQVGFFRASPDCDTPTFRGAW